MAIVGQVYYNVVSADEGKLISSGEDIYTNIVAAIGATQFNKLGIQAPPGTQVVLNETKTILIGRTGMYELDDDIAIEHMYFIRPKNYVLNQEATDAALLAGAEGIIAAEEAREEGLAKLGTATTDQAYIDGYKEVQEIYAAAYEQALYQYEQGVAGIYELDGENPTQDLFNIIVDFIWE